MTVSGRRSRLNAPFAVAGGACLTMADALMHPLLILPLFVAQLTTSYRSVALIVAVSSIGWFLGQLVAPPLLRTTVRQLPWALGGAIVRLLAIVLLAYDGYNSAGESNEQRLRTFFVCLIAFSVANGFSHHPTLRLLDRTLPPSSQGASIAWRNGLGLLLAIVAGLVARRALGAGSPPFPKNFSLIFVVAAAALALSTFLLTRLREVPGRSPDLEAASANILSPLKDGNLLRLMSFAGLAALASGADPFFVIFALRGLALPLHWAGIYLVVSAAAILVSTPLWRALLLRAGPRALLQGAVAVHVLAPILAIAIPRVATSALYLDKVTNPRLALALYAVVFASISVAVCGQAIGVFAYLNGMAPDHARARYASVMNLLLLVAAAAPLLAARILERDGFERLFLISSIAGLATVFASGLLANPNARAQTPSQAWRLRGIRP